MQRKLSFPSHCYSQFKGSTSPYHSRYFKWFVLFSLSNIHYLHKIQQNRGCVCVCVCMCVYVCVCVSVTSANYDNIVFCPVCYPEQTVRADKQSLNMFWFCLSPLFADNYLSVSAKPNSNGHYRYYLWNVKAHRRLIIAPPPPKKRIACNHSVCINWFSCMLIIIHNSI